MFVKSKKKVFDWGKFGAVAVGIFFIVSASFFSGVLYSDRAAVFGKTNKQSSLWNKLTGREVANAQSDSIDGQLFSDVWNALRENYVDTDKLSDKDMLYGALAGLAASTEDPYTVYMTPSSTKEFQQDMAGSFEGIGAEIGLKNDIITVVAPLDGMPAQKAGVRSGDKITKINGEITLGMTTNDAVRKIRGPKGTFVNLTISREGQKELLEFKIKRDIIKIKSVKTETKDGIFIIHISSFNDDTEQLFAEAVNKAVSSKPKGIILDLRNNPGGYLSTSIRVASYWVEKGPIVGEKYSDGHIENTDSLGLSLLKNYKTVVLINEGSASASEIVAGALQDTKKATIIGKKSFGKGSVQMIKDFYDGSSLKVTTAKWLTPAGRSIDKEGITPDVVVELTKKDFDANKDPQMTKALEIIKKPVKPAVKK